MNNSIRNLRAILLPVLFVFMLGEAAWSAEPFVIKDQKQFRRIVAPEAALKKLAGDMQFLEGPVWQPANGGSLIFSDIPANVLRKWSPTNGVEIFRKPSHQANGNALDAFGRLLTCEHATRRVSRTEPDGSIRTLIDQYQGRKLNSPNDLAIRRDGTIWFTDPTYGIKPEQKEQPGNYVYCFDEKSGEIKTVATDFDMPNGICFSPDDQRLFVADSGKPRHIRVFQVASGHRLKENQVFAAIDSGAPDGVRCDAQGRLFSSAGDGVHIFDPSGRLIGKILVPESPANLCFGGDHGQTLFITARRSLYSIELLPSVATPLENTN